MPRKSDGRSASAERAPRGKEAATKSFTAARKLVKPKTFKPEQVEPPRFFSSWGIFCPMNLLRGYNAAVAGLVAYKILTEPEYLAELGPDLALHVLQAFISEGSPAWLKDLSMVLNSVRVGQISGLLSADASGISRGANVGDVATHGANVVAMSFF